MDIEVEAAVAGARVLWVSQRNDDARAALDAHAALHISDMERVTRSNGREHIKYKSGGEIRYVSVRSQGGRGYSADLLSITHSDYMNADLMVTLLPCMATSDNARVIIRTEPRTA